MSRFHTVAARTKAQPLIDLRVAVPYHHLMNSPLSETFLAFLRLGLTSFGGPVAHLGYFHSEFVQKRQWLSEQSYADLVALCQFLPGPVSSQVGMALGLSRAGLAGALAAWMAFTLPSAIFLVLFAFGLSSFQNILGPSALHGLKIAAVSVVAQALWSMTPKLCPDRQRQLLAVLAALFVLSAPTAWAQIAAILGGGLCGLLFLKSDQVLPHNPIPHRLSNGTGAALLSSFLFLLLGLPVMSRLWSTEGLQLFDRFYRAGSLVFGGGHVVLPLLQAEVVPRGWVSVENFMAGYGAAQAIPGPLFSFSAFLGAVAHVSLPALWAAVICLVAAFLPAFLLITGALPFWEKLRAEPRVRRALPGINAAVVGILLAAFYNPVWTSAIHQPRDLALALIGFLLLVRGQTPSWLMVILLSFGAWAASL